MVYSSFDSNTDTALIDNCANTHIWNNRSQFSNFRIIPKEEQGVSTIGGSPHFALGIGDISTSWKDDDGNVFQHTLKNVLYFPNSPVCIISTSKLATEWGYEIDYEGTYIKSKHSYSVFKWKNKQFRRTIQHPTHCLPELAVNEGYTSFEKFCHFCSTKSASIRHPWSSYFSAHTTIDNEPTILQFKPGTKLRYSRDGYTSSCVVLESSVSDPNVINIRLYDGEELSTSPTFLQHIDDPDIACVPESPSDFVREVPMLDDEDLSFLSNPKALDDDDIEYLEYHNRLNHLSRDDMYRLSSMNVIPSKFQKYKTSSPFCASCAFGKAHRRQWRFKGKKSGTIRKSTDDAPGKRVSVDQLVSAQPGLIPQLSGHLTRARIFCATIFVDHFSGFGYSFLQRSTTQEETLEAKAAFEKMANTYDVIIAGYHADNGRFAEARFREQCELEKQTLSYCAVGAHHQNGIAESNIKTFTLGARTCLLHAKRLWPEAITTMLWPFALQYYVESYNTFHMDKEHRTPLMKFSGSLDLPDVTNFHPFGCPVFVLESKLQTSSKGLPKWDPRSRLGIYLGHSPLHAGSVALVLNPSTGHVSPQYHVVFDDKFTTVNHMRTGTVPSNWRDLVENSSFCSTDEQFSLADVWLRENTFSTDDPASAPPLPTAEAIEVSEGASTPLSSHVPTTPLPPPSEGDHLSPPLVSEGDAVDFSDSPSSPLASACEGDAEIPKPSPTDTETSLRPHFINLDASGLRRSTRARKPPDRYTASTSATSTKRGSFFSKFQFVGLTALCAAIFAAQAVHVNARYVNPNSNSVFASTVNTIHNLNSHFDCTLNVLSTFAYAAMNDTNDTFTFKEMCQQPDMPKFIDAMVKEVADHNERLHWDIIPRAEIPAGMKTILAVWSFKRKRLPDGTITKWKARLCCHGGMQQWGVNYWETYAPVVCWASIRVILIIAAINRIPTRSIDFVLAFPQADVDVPVYMELPIGIELAGENKRHYVLKLNKNLYGLKQASLTWFEMLSKGLVDRGFTASKIDPCVFIRDNCIILVYVDDCIIISPDTKVIDRFVASMQNGHENFKLTDEGDLARFLGVEITYKDDGVIEMTQKHLISRIIEACKVDPNAMNSRDTPAGKPLLNKDLNGEQRRHTWNYRSAVGMLNYLTSSTRPEISMAVHQCARFTNNPMLSHERAVTRICRYLLSSRDKGIAYRPDNTLGLQCYVDADFAGGWSQLDADNPDNLMSRTGYVIMYAGCPILWSSKLQTEIALSTTEAEYIALSQATREVLPLIELLKELDCVLKVNQSKPSFYCEVFEDNRSTIAVATSNKFTPRTKHIALKYHHFRQFVRNKTIVINPIDTKEQIADIFTKPLEIHSFKHLRMKLLGW